MKEKLTFTLPQIRCSEKTRKLYDNMASRTKRSISNILQIQTEYLAVKYEEKGIIFDEEIFKDE